MKVGLWCDSSGLSARRVPSVGGRYVIFYELAPTGMVHVGVLRTLIRMKQLRTALLESGEQVVSILRVNDRAALRCADSHSHSHDYRGFPLTRVPSPIPGHESYYHWSVADILRVLDLYSIPFDRVCTMTDVCEIDAFRQGVSLALQRLDEVLDRVSDSQRVPPEFFRPSCDSCGRTYYAKVLTLDSSGCGMYVCSVCGYEGTFSVFENRGLITFKIEMALTWKALDVSFDCHGVNHYEAVNTSRTMYRALGFGEPPGTCMVNITLGPDGKMVSKSRGNSKAVSQMTDEERGVVEALIERTPVHRPLVLPPSLWCPAGRSGSEGV